MNRALRPWVLMAGVMLVSGCSTLDAINPFSTTVPKVKPAELGTLQASRDLRLRWQGAVGKTGEFRFTPAVSGTSVYAASRDGTVARFDNGQVVWRVSAGQVLSGGVGSDGQRVVVGTPKGEILAFDAASGRELWRARVNSEVLAAPVVAEGMAVVRSGDSRIYAFEVADGKRRWVYQRSTPSLSLRSAVSVVVDGRVTLAGFPGGKLVAIANNNGAAVWEVTVALPKGATELERVADITSNPVAKSNVVCAAAYQGRVSCFDTQNGNALWSKEMSSQAGLDMDERNVYVTDDKGAVHAFDRSRGASVWRQDKLFLRGVTRPLAMGDVIAVGDYQGFAHLLRRDDGAFVGRVATDGSAVQSELIPQGKDGFVMQTVNGGVFALEVR